MKTALGSRSANPFPRHARARGAPAGTRSVAAALTLAAIAGCATAGEAAPPRPPPFRDIRSLVLVRGPDEMGRYPRDPIGALDDSLRERGFTTRAIDLGYRPPPDLQPLARLFGRLESLAASGRSGVRMDVAGGEASQVIERLQADAVVSFHRMDRRRPPDPLAPPSFPGSAFPQRFPAAGGPAAAFVLMDREGHAATFAWGDEAPLADPSIPLNAAEAIEALVRALTGEPAEE